MASPSAAQFQSWTDRIAAILKLDLAGWQNELTGATVDSLANLIDGSADASLQAALLGYGLAVDNQSLPERYYRNLASLYGRQAIGDFIRALNNYVISPDGGAYGNLRAALADKGALVHPLFAEAAIQKLGPGAFGDSDGYVTTVFAPNYQAISPARVYTGADGALVDDTVDAVDVGTADIALFATDDFCLYLGSPYKFTQAIPGLSTLASVTIAPTFEYWDGNQWATLSVTDNGVGFTKNDTIKWTSPANWTRCNKDAGGTAFADLTPLYYVRISRTANTLVTPPVGTCIRLIPALVRAAGTSGAHLGLDQPPLALVRITGSGVCVNEILNAPDLTKFKAPAVRLRALTPIGTTLTLTLAYTDQSGNADSQVQSAFTTPAALDTQNQVLDGADTGVRAILGTTSVALGAVGVLALEVVETRTPAL